MTGSTGANIEIRSAAESELDALRDQTSYAFANNELPADPPDPHLLAPEQTLCGFEGERMVATSGAFDFRMRFNGNAVRADGVTMVSCDPGYRRRGIVRQLITGLLLRSRERGVPMSILWASMGAIYQRFGYGLATTAVGYDIPTRYVQFEFGERPAGRVALLDLDTARPLLDQIYRQFSATATGMLHRGGFYWDVMLRRVGGQHTYAAVYFADDAEPQGYCLYRTRTEAGPPMVPNQVIDVFDLSWLTIDAYRGIWHFLGGHDLSERIRMTFVAPDDPAPNLLLEPRMLNRRTWDGVWLRVVDAEQALAGRGYDAPGEVLLEVVDDLLCPWNNGCYRLQAGPAGAQVERAGAGGEPELVVPPTAMASLLMGQSRVTDLVRMGRASLADGRRAADLDALFATRRPPHCPNMF